MDLGVWVRRNGYARISRFAILLPFVFFCALALSESAARAQSIDLSSLTNANNLVDPSVAKALIGSVGRLGDFRPYQPATALKRSFDLGIELTVEKVDDDLRAALQKIGAGSSSLPALGVAKVHFHKGIGDAVDIGVAGVGYSSYLLMWGITGKVVVYEDEESPTWAIRLNYASTKVYFVKTNTWTPQVLVSRRIEFADPYLGVGWQFVSGEIDTTQTVAGQSIRYQKSGSANAFMAFMGLALRVPEVGFKITMEGAYNQSMGHTLGVKIGFEI